MAGLTWELLQDAFTAETLMTPRDDWFTWEYGTDLPARMAEAKEQNFDLLPVVMDEQVVGVLYEGIAEPEALTDRWLVSRDTAIPDLLALFVESRQPGFFVLHRQELVGLVTPADLNKMPARVYVYNVIGELELALAYLVRAHFRDDPDQLLPMLSEEREDELRVQIDKLRDENADVDAVQFLYLSELIRIVAKTQPLRSALGYSSKSETKRELGGLNDLRDQTMHPVRTLLGRIPEDLVKLRKRISRTRELLERIETSA